MTPQLLSWAECLCVCARKPPAGSNKAHDTFNLQYSCGLVELPDGLSRLRAIRSGLLYERQVDELNRELAGAAPPRMLMPWNDPREIRKVEEKRHREQLAYEQAMSEISERRDRLLLRIEEEQARTDERRREIDDNRLQFLAQDFKEFIRIAGITHSGK